MRLTHVIIFFSAFCIALLLSRTVYAYMPEGVYYEPVEPLLPLPIPRRTHLPIKTLTLRDAILLSLRTNPTIRSAEIQRVADKFALEVAHNRYEPQYAFTASAVYQPGSKPQYTFSPGITWLLPLGTQLQFNYNQTILGGAGAGSSLTSVITQPLLQGFGPKITMAPLLQAEYGENTARLTFKNTIITTITQVIAAYFQLVQSQNNLITDELALENSLTLLSQYHIRIRAGQAAPLEIAPLEAQVASQRLTITQDKNTIQQNYQALLIILGLDPNSKLHIDNNITIDSFKLPSLEKSTGLALENNISYQQAIYALKNQEIAVMLAKDQQRWSLNLVATKTVTPGAGSSGVTPVNGTSTPGSDSVALNLTIPINDKALQQTLVDAKVGLAQQKIQLSQDKLQLQSQVLNGFQSLIYQAQQIKQAEDQVHYAQIALDAERIKLRYGRTTMLDVTNLQTNLTQAQLALISQKINYINTLAAFQALLGITLEIWGIEVYY